MAVVKGGVWTNIEDEILKAAISKYGLNQWSRVSSLLARKTAKQCKARWTEWLDPSIRKTEWSREEDEKLLHLAKILPTQWRTIAEHVGRTANQCLDRYQRLLDEAESREATLGLSGPDGAESQAPTGTETRRLRSGDMDPDPETKPARPDTIDLDEDEKEMLSEARARLANTQGKKAKRKARERQQEESKRLAALQKRRELKSAGINIKITNRKQGQMDYNADIPFERKPAAGFYDTSEELSRNEQERLTFDPHKQQQLAAKRRSQEEEEESKRKRHKTNEKGKNEGPSEAAKKAAQLQRLREAEQSSRRRALVLPKPQVGDAELEDIVKMGMLGEKANSIVEQSGNDTTKGLVSDYTKLTHSSGPIRTPRVEQQDDHIANEIRTIRALNETQSVLLGDENTPLRQGSTSTGFEGMAPRKQVIATPNPLATPLRPSGGKGSDTAGQTPLRTPRDSLALNESGSMDLEFSRSGALLRDRLKSLPKPKESEWELEVPDEQVVPTANASSAARVEDAAERDRRERARREADEARERKRRTQALQRDLPRPPVVDTRIYEGVAFASEAERLVAEETLKLLVDDARKYPVGSTSSSSSSEFTSVVGPVPSAPEKFSDASLRAARALLDQETKSKPLSLTPADLDVIFESSIHPNPILASLRCPPSASPETARALVMHAYGKAARSLTGSAAQASKMEKKLSLHLGGYMKRQQLLRTKLSSAYEASLEAARAFSAFEMLAIREERGQAQRLAGLRDEVSFVSRREREAQERYRRAQEELAQLG